MKRFLLIVTVILSCQVILLSGGNAHAASSCQVADKSDRTDSAGNHYNVTAADGKYLGYISLLNEPKDKWVVWVDGKGASNTQYLTREEAIQAICR